MLPRTAPSESPLDPRHPPSALDQRRLQPRRRAAVLCRFRARHPRGRTKACFRAAVSARSFTPDAGPGAWAFAREGDCRLAPSQHRAGGQQTRRASGGVIRQAGGLTVSSHYRLWPVGSGVVVRGGMQQWRVADAVAAELGDGMVLRIAAAVAGLAGLAPRKPVASATPTPTLIAACAATAGKANRTTTRTLFTAAPRSSSHRPRRARYACRPRSR